MFISTEQLSLSLAHLADLNPFFGMSFLAFKREGLPIGDSRTITFTTMVQGFLEEFYRPVDEYKGFYNPFHTSDKSNRWTAARYGSTSLQRITTDTFRDAFIHPKKESTWGWADDYLLRLEKHLGNRKIPAFDLAVWLYRSHEWPERITPVDLVIKLRADFQISEDEYEVLFLDSFPLIGFEWISSDPSSDSDLLSVIGDPPGLGSQSGAALRQLRMHEVGPAKDLIYVPAERLNIITGNNSLGKTFLLECMWWALTGEWLGFAADPHRNVSKREPYINFNLASPKRHEQAFTSTYNWDRQEWSVKPSNPRSPGLTIYARHDGSFAIWDPARAQLERNRHPSQYPGRIFLSRTQVWDGTKIESEGFQGGRSCNGLLSDWILWQTGGERYRHHYSAFVSSLKELSPSEDEPLHPGEPTRFPLDSRPIPTLEMPYGIVPILHASAAVQRVVALAYILVWAWQEHLVSCDLIRQTPQRSIVIIVDEIEAHLHPMWQRLIAPALIQVADRLAGAVTCQLHIATHSPLVLASVESLFDRDLDALHHLKAVGQTVELHDIPFVRRGRADLWLLSEAFGLGQARSLPAERAIEQAKALQLSEFPDKNKIREVDEKLRGLLASDDDFWPRWKYFAENNSQ